MIDLESRNKDIWTILMYYGYPNQRLKAMEELSELLLALARIRILSKRGSEPYANLVEEMADVEVMMAQMRMHYDIDTEEVSRIANEKIPTSASHSKTMRSASNATPRSAVFPLRGRLAIPPSDATSRLSLERLPEATQKSTFFALWKPSFIKNQN